jgi:hypothetical protein
LLRCHLSLPVSLSSPTANSSRRPRWNLGVVRPEVLESRRRPLRGHRGGGRGGRGRPSSGHGRTRRARGRRRRDVPQRWLGRMRRWVTRTRCRWCRSGQCQSVAHRGTASATSISAWADRPRSSWCPSTTRWARYPWQRATATEPGYRSAWCGQGLRWRNSARAFED